MSRLLLINGPNLNLLGQREPGIYGQATLEDIVAKASRKATQLGHELISFQSNHEGELISRIHEAKVEQVAMILINPAAFTHTSVAIRDALLAIGIPFIEVHLSNIHARESFRSHSYLSDIARGVISGFGPFSYQLAIEAAAAALDPTREP